MCRKVNIQNAAMIYFQQKKFMLQHRIAQLKEKKLIGMMMPMNFAYHQPHLLWQQFMPRRKEILNVVGSDLFSIEIFPDNFFEAFNPLTEFKKCAAIEVSDFDLIPIGMHSIIFPEGLYAVFIHHGSQEQAMKTYNYIFREWIPQSGFSIDNRPHFAVMGSKYKRDSDDSEEEIWIPIKHAS